LIIGHQGRLVLSHRAQGYASSVLPFGACCQVAAGRSLGYDACNNVPGSGSRGELAGRQAKGIVAVKRQVELLEKNRPRQARAKRTYEAILNAAAELLVEVGIERISTNLVAERAGVTVPALYRYFPNKYSVLNALGAGLMDQQNSVFQQWFDDHARDAPPQALLDNVYVLLQRTYAVTRAQSGGLELVQALRAVAPLQEVRLQSHRLVARRFAALVSELLQKPMDELLMSRARISIDVGYAIVEMALEEDRVETERILLEGAQMIQAYWGSILLNEQQAP
tara:strand:+ start:2583 stop:3425 length:843 start_codon:yes stop_codon:yes gene_type:complete